MDEISPGSGNSPLTREAMGELIEHSALPQLVVDESRIVVANAAARKVLGQHILLQDPRVIFRHPAAVHLLARPEAGSIVVQGLTGPRSAWQITRQPIDGQHWLLELVDRTAAADVSRAHTDFVANASHELRTPLATIIGYAETLADGSELPEELRLRFSLTIGEEARRMLQIIEDLMSLSRIEADRFVAPTGSVSAADAIGTAVANMGLLVGDRQCRVETDVAAPLPNIRGDSRQIVQVLDNLLSNAARYGCSGAQCRIRLCASQENGFVRIEIADEGPGIPKEHLSRLTERFYRVDAARSRDAGGTGLGLAIVKHIVERHRGMLDISSEPGVGTTVAVRLPIAA